MCDAATPSMPDARFRTCAHTAPKSACVVCISAPHHRFQCQHAHAHRTPHADVNTDGPHNDKQVLFAKPPECACTSVVCRERPVTLTRPPHRQFIASVQRVSCPGSRLEQLADRRVPIPAREGERGRARLRLRVLARAGLLRRHGHEYRHAAQMLERGRWGTPRAVRGRTARDRSAR